jgi:hypothetical protein
MNLSKYLLPVLLVLLFGSPAFSQEKAGASFWMAAPEKGPNGIWTVYVPRATGLRQQGMLLSTVLGTPYEPSQSKEVLAQLYSDIEQFKMLGQKEIVFGDAVGSLLSFRGLSGQKSLLGRALLRPEGEGTAVLLLVRHPQADARLLKSFEVFQEDWTTELPQEDPPENP